MVHATPCTGAVCCGYTNASEVHLGSADSETKVARIEQQRMRKALIDAEIELQQGTVAAQDKRKALQASPHVGEAWPLDLVHDTQYQ